MNFKKKKKKGRHDKASLMQDADRDRRTLRVPHLATRIKVKPRKLVKSSENVKKKRLTNKCDSCDCPIVPCHSICVMIISRRAGDRKERIVGEQYKKKERKAGEQTY